MSKLDVPQDALENVSRYLDSVASPDGKYAYTLGTFSTPAVTAEGYLCRQYLGWKQNDQRLIDGVGALNQNRVERLQRPRPRHLLLVLCHPSLPSHGRRYLDQVELGHEAGGSQPPSEKWPANRKLGPQWRQMGQFRGAALRDLPVDLHARSLLPALAPWKSRGARPKTSFPTRPKFRFRPTARYLTLK